MNVSGDPRPARSWIRVSRLGGLLALGLLTMTMVAPRFTAIPYSRPAALASFAVLAVATWVLLRRGGLPSDRLARRLALPVGVACTALSAFVGYATYYVTTWDSKLIQNLVARAPEQVSAYEIAYLSRYPNNDLLLMLARQAHRLAEATGLDYGTVFLAFQVVFLAVTLAGVYRLCLLMGDHTTALAAMVLVTLLVGLSPWMAVPYTDVPSMWTPVWAIYCVIRAHRARNRRTTGAWALAAGGILAIGVALKTTPLVVIVAATLWFVAVALGDRDRRTWIACTVRVGCLAAGVAIGMLMSGPLVARWAEPPATTHGVSASVWHYVASGIRVQVGPNHNRIFGGYDRPTNSATFGKPTPVQDRISKHMISAELKRRGVLGTLAFEVNKLDFNWGDGMLWAYGEGSDLSRRPVHHGQPFETVQSWNSPSGQLFGPRVALTQALWWLVLALAAVGWLRGRVTAESLLLLVTLVGVAAFTLLFQGRSRYLITYVPLLAVAALWWTADVRPHVAAGRRRVAAGGRAVRAATARGRHRRRPWLDG
ncbi:glycosyltransferase family 39 protein [Terrabacter sp. BE26]|uniref:glycosyltransferase family 39 protein n=1 Tax=Terrabacter sp. BE26 TaxID=2898152 RepID=UPI0035BE259B